MSVRVELKHKETGEITTHFSVDAADILGRGEHVQIGGPRVVPVASKAPAEKPADGPVLKQTGGGKYNVVLPDGSNANPEPLKKADAQALLASLTSE